MDAELAAMSAVELQERLATAELDVAAAAPGEDFVWACQVRGEVRAALRAADAPSVDEPPSPGDTVIELRDGVPWIGTYKPG